MKTQEQINRADIDVLYENQKMLEGRINRHEFARRRMQTMLNRQSYITAGLLIINILTIIYFL